MDDTSKLVKPISRRDRAYYKRRNQNRIHAALATFFAEEAAAGRITKKQLADLIEKNPAQITRWLTEPSNYEADTISEILLGMNAEMDHHVVRFSERAEQNYVHPIAERVMGPQKLPPRPHKGKNISVTSATATSQPTEIKHLVAAE